MWIYSLKTGRWWPTATGFRAQAAQNRGIQTAAGLGNLAEQGKESCDGIYRIKGGNFQRFWGQAGHVLHTARLERWQQTVIQKWTVYNSFTQGFWLILSAPLLFHNLLWLLYKIMLQLIDREWGLHPFISNSPIWDMKLNNHNNSYNVIYNPQVNS